MGKEGDIIATRYVQQATQQLNPAYNTQINALQGQLAPLENLYKTLMGSLGGVQQAGNLQALEGANARGVLQSTIPVYDQALVGQQVAQQGAQYANDYLQNTGKIRSDIAGVGVNRANDISQLAQALMQGALNQQQLAYQKQQANRQYQVDLARARGGY